MTKYIKFTIIMLMCFFSIASSETLHYKCCTQKNENGKNVGYNQLKDIIIAEISNELINNESYECVLLKQGIDKYWLYFDKNDIIRFKKSYSGGKPHYEYFDSNVPITFLNYPGLQPLISYPSPEWASNVNSRDILYKVSKYSTIKQTTFQNGIFKIAELKINSPNETLNNKFLFTFRNGALWWDKMEVYNSNGIKLYWYERCVP